MRKQKMANLAAAQAKAQAAAQVEAQAASQIEVQVDVPSEPKGRVLKQDAHSSIQLISRPPLAAEEPHELSVELSGGKTISQGIVSIV